MIVILVFDFILRIGLRPLLILGLVLGPDPGFWGSDIAACSTIERPAPRILGFRSKTD